MVDEDEKKASPQPKRIKKFNSSEASEDHQSIHILLSDIAIEILLKLPVESLLQCKSVCKSWYSLISDPHFIKSHLRLSTSNNHHHRLIFSTVPAKALHSCPLYNVLNDKSINVLCEKSSKVLELNHQLNYPRTSVWIVGSCNGLLCIDVWGDGVYIWNPSTRRSKRLPDCGKPRFYGFGYDSFSDDYKVVAISGKGGTKVKAKIYSLKSGKWKKIADFPGLPVNDYCMFLNGALHWGAKQKSDSSYTWKIVSLDLATGIYGEVKQPVYDEGYTDLTIGVVGECLCVLCNNRRNCADVWVMKVYGVQDSWTKLVSVPNLTERVQFCEPPLLCFADDGKLLLHCGWKLVRYDVEKDEFLEINNGRGAVESCIIVESLVSVEGPRRRSKRQGLKSRQPRMLYFANRSVTVRSK